jgi:uncharacterized protein YbbC (DUF1343 family)
LAVPAQGAVRVGAEVAAADGFETLRDRRVGLITHNAATIGGQRVLDVLARAEGVELVAVFAPEHGLDARAPAGDLVDDDVEASLSVPVHSLYGELRAPTPELLTGVDVLVFDLQDVGVRAYTYLSTMGLAMVAAAEVGIPFVVLDRPNPQGGALVSGYGRDPDQVSFVSQYPVPGTHGMTAGELALAIRGEGWLPGLDALELEVVAMEGWTRGQHWPDTELAWPAPSPGLPTVASAMLYPGTVLLEATSISMGRGTPEPFTVAGAPWVDGEAVAAELNRRSLPGVRTEPVSFTPVASPSMPDPAYEGEVVNGVRLVVVDPRALRPVELGVHLLDVLVDHGHDRGVGDIITRPDTFDLLAGTDRLRLALARGEEAEAVIASWAPEVEAFHELRRPYLLYE